MAPDARRNDDVDFVDPEADFLPDRIEFLKSRFYSVGEDGANAARFAFYATPNRELNSVLAEALYGDEGRKFDVVSVYDERDLHRSVSKSASESPKQSLPLPDLQNGDVVVVIYWCHDDIFMVSDYQSGVLALTVESVSDDCIYCSKGYSIGCVDGSIFRNVLQRDNKIIFFSRPNRATFYLQILKVVSIESTSDV